MDKNIRGGGFVDLEFYPQTMNMKFENRKRRVKIFEQ